MLLKRFQVKDLTEAAVYKLRKHVEQVDDIAEDDEDIGDDFENLYKGEISKSGVPILPSKRARKVPEKIQVSQDDLSQLKNTPEESSVETKVENTEDSESEDISLDELEDAEDQTSKNVSEDPNNTES